MPPSKQSGLYKLISLYSISQLTASDCFEPLKSKQITEKG